LNGPIVGRRYWILVAGAPWLGGGGGGGGAGMTGADLAGIERAKSACGAARGALKL